MNDLLPQIDRIGWHGKEGLDKLLAYVAGMAPALGGAAPAFAAVADSIATMTTKKLQKRFADAGVDIQQILVEARQRGEDEFAAFIRAANTAVNAVGIGRIFISPEQQRWFKALVQNVEQIDARHRELRNSIGEVAKDSAKLMEDSQSKINRLGTAWKEFKQDLGAAIVEAGALEFLDKARTMMADILALMGELDAKQRAAKEAGKPYTPYLPAQLAHEHAEHFREHLPEWRPGRRSRRHRARHRMRPSNQAARAPAAPASGIRPAVQAPAAASASPDKARPAAMPVRVPASQPDAAAPASAMGPRRASGASTIEPMAALALASTGSRSTGQAYNAALGTELNKSVGMIRQFTDWMGKALGVRVSPSIAPSFETAPGTQGPGSRASMLSRGAFSDSGSVPVH